MFLVFLELVSLVFKTCKNTDGNVVFALTDKVALDVMSDQWNTFLI